MMASMADLIGYVYRARPRRNTSRIIERGTLRHYSAIRRVGCRHSSRLHLHLSLHFIWVEVGHVMSNAKFLPNNTKVMAMMGIKRPPECARRQQ